ncbi:MAG: hypothetical protein AAGB48_02985 [Planctomycetota bacterium]
MSGLPDAAAADPVLPEVVMHLHRPNDPGTARVVESRLCMAGKSASYVRHLALDVSGTEIAGRFRAGQSFGVLTPGENDKGRPHAPRLYSIASPTAGEDGNGAVLATTVKRTIDEHHDDHALFLGVASNYLCDLQVGDEVRVSGPNGKRFLLPAEQADWNYVFFATGTGIAPFRGMLGDLYQTDAPAPDRTTLVMGSPYRTDLLYDEEFTQLARAHDGLSYLTAISRETPDGVGRGQYVQDVLTSHRDHFTDLLTRPNTLVYICGIAGMELGIFQALAGSLPPEVLARFLVVDPEAAAEPGSWSRRMIHKQIKPTRRVFLEVY